MDENMNLEEQNLDKGYRIRLEKYTSGNMLDSLKERLEGVLSFGFNVLFPLSLSGIISLGLAILFGYLYKSLIFGILLFAATIPVFFFGIGSLGLAKAIKDFIEGINYILCYTLNVSNDIRQTLKKERNCEVDNKEVAKIAVNNVVLPAAEKIVSRSFLGGIAFNLIKKILKKSMQDLGETIKDEITCEECNGEDLLYVPNKTYQKINGITVKVVKGIVLLLRIIGILSVFLGLFLLILLFIMHYVF
jgi:hypothetical protein